MRTVALTKESTKDILENLLKRSPNNYGKFEAAVDEILNKVKTEGDAALFAYTKEFDKTEISADTIKVTEEEIKEKAIEVAKMYSATENDKMVDLLMQSQQAALRADVMRNKTLNLILGK